MSSFNDTFSNWSMPEIGPSGGMGYGGRRTFAPETLDEAYARGFTDGAREGAQEGSAAAAERLRTACEAIEAAAETLRNSHAAFLGDLEETMSVLALAVARQIVQREITADASILPELVRQAAETLPADVPLTVRLNPEDFAAQGWGGSLHAEPDTAREVRWVADGAIAHGGYVIESPQRLLDGQLDSSLRSFYEYLRDG